MRFSLLRINALNALSLRPMMLGAILIALSACQEETAETPEPIRPVRSQVAEYADWKSSVSAIGEIKPRIEIELGFRLSGKIAQRMVDVGDAVQQGTVIARLDPAELRTAVQISDTEIQAAKAELDDASGVEQRQKKLLEHGNTTRAAYESSFRLFKQAQARLDSAELAKKNASDQLGYTDLVVDGEGGVVTAVLAEAGEVIASGQPVVRLARLEEKEAQFKVSDLVLRTVPEESVVEVFLIDDTDISATGRVREVGTTADAVTRTFTVRVALDSPPAEMRFGATVQGRVVLSEARVVSLPSSALFRLDGNAAVWIFDPSTETVALQPVTVLRYESDKFLVSAGLAGGEHVVTAGVQKLWPGRKARLQ